MRKPEKGCLLDSLHEPSDEQLGALMRTVGLKVTARRANAMANFWAGLSVVARQAKPAALHVSSRQAPQA